MALDFDASVVGIVSQPFWLCWTRWAAASGAVMFRISWCVEPAGRDGARFAARGG